MIWCIQLARYTHTHTHTHTHTRTRTRSTLTLTLLLTVHLANGASGMFTEPRVNAFHVKCVHA